MRPALLALLLAAAPAAPAHDALQAIDDCVGRLDSELDVGYARISARCPELAPALDSSGYARWLPADWRRSDNELSAAGLSELRAQLAREGSAHQAQHAAPRSEQLAAALATVAQSEQDAGRSWWQRLKDWLRALIATKPQADEAWLRRLLGRFELRASTAQLISAAALAVIVALAAAIIINELRIAGLLGRRRAQRAQARAVAAPRDPSARALADIERAAPEEQPALLLELIALRLASTQRMLRSRALTARELERQALLPGQSTRARLLELVSVCERVRFSAQQVSPASLAAAVRSGRVLLAALDAPPGAAAAVGS